MKEPAFSVGIEEEYQIIDPVTRDLTAGFSKLVLDEDPVLADVKPELHQCQVEIGSKPCANVQQLQQFSDRQQRFQGARYLEEYQS